MEDTANLQHTEDMVDGVLQFLELDGNEQKDIQVSPAEILPDGEEPIIVDHDELDVSSGNESNAELERFIPDCLKDIKIEAFPNAKRYEYKDIIPLWHSQYIKEPSKVLCDTIWRTELSKDTPNPSQVPDRPRNNAEKLTTTWNDEVKRALSDDIIAPPTWSETDCLLAAQMYANYGDSLEKVPDDYTKFTNDALALAALQAKLAAKDLRAPSSMYANYSDGSNSAPHQSDFEMSPKCTLSNKTDFNTNKLNIGALNFAGSVNPGLTSQNPRQYNATTYNMCLNGMNRPPQTHGPEPKLPISQSLPIYNPADMSAVGNGTGDGANMYGANNFLGAASNRTNNADALGSPLGPSNFFRQLIAANPFAGANPFGAANPFAGANPFGAANPIAGANPFGAANPLAAANPYSASSSFSSASTYTTSTNTASAATSSSSTLLQANPLLAASSQCRINNLVRERQLLLLQSQFRYTPAPVSPSAINERLLYAQVLQQQIFQQTVEQVDSLARQILNSHQTRFPWDAGTNTNTNFPVALPPKPLAPCPARLSTSITGMQTTSSAHVPGSATVAQSTLIVRETTIDYAGSEFPALNEGANTD